MVKFFSMKMKHVPEASDIPSFADAVGGAGREGVEHQLDIVAQVRGFVYTVPRALRVIRRRDGGASLFWYFGVYAIFLFLSSSCTGTPATYVSQNISGTLTTPLPPNTLRK